jgi:hypothetical protein
MSEVIDGLADREYAYGFHSDLAAGSPMGGTGNPRGPIVRPWSTPRQSSPTAACRSSDNRAAT